MVMVEVFGRNVVAIDNKEIAERYAQAIRRGLWQCNITLEPWNENAQHLVSDSEGNESIHVCDENCCDTRTDDEVKVGTEY